MIEGKHINIVGFGNQARAWAANLQDSGLAVRVMLRDNSSSLQKVQSLYQVLPWNQKCSGTTAVLVPDHEIPHVVKHLSQLLEAGSTVIYAHGYALAEAKLDKVYPQFHHVLLAPKAIGLEVRATYVDKRPLGGVYSVDKVLPASKRGVEQLTLGLAQQLGINLGPYPCTVEQETTADLFSEQAVLCSLIPESCRIAFNMLREKGIPPELAFFELWHEVGLIVKVMVDKGPEAFFDLISPNALIGSEKGRELLCGDEFKAKLQTLLSDIESGTFNQEVKTHDAEELRSQVKQRWKNDEFNHIIQVMQKRMQGLV